MVGVSLPTPQAPQSPLKGVAQAISTGMEYGTRMRANELNREKLEAGKLKYEQQTTDANIKIIEKEQSVFSRFPKMSRKSKEISLRKMNEIRSLRGMKPYDEIFTEEMLAGSPELMQKSATARNAILKGDATLEQTADYLEAMGEENYEIAIDQAGKIATAKEEAVTEFGREALMEQFKAGKKVELEEKKAGIKKEEAKGELATTITKEAGKISSRYRNWLGAAETIRTIKLSELSGTDAVSALKAFNQFWDTARVTEGEMETVKGARSMFHTVKDMWNKYIADPTKPLVVGKQLIKDMQKTTKRLDSIIKDRLASDILPWKERAEKAGLGLSPFTGSQRKLFAKELGKKTKEKVPRGTTPGIKLPPNLTTEQKAKLERYRDYTERNKLEITQKKVDRLFRK